jgi:hypothetical protein
MEQRQQEIYDDIIRRRGPKNPLTKSQKKHLKKVAKRRVRSEKRKEKQLLEQQRSGKLIEENHNGGEYSPEFTDKAASWHLRELFERFPKFTDISQFLLYFRSRRPKYQTLLLKWSSGLPRDSRFYFLKELLDTYWKDKTDGEALKTITEGYLEHTGTIQN